MFVSSSKSKNHIVHNESCCYAERIKNENKIAYASLNGLLMENMCFCKHCSLPVKIYNEEKEQIQNFICDNDILLKFDDFGLNVTTPYGKWRICRLNNNCLSLYHKNTRITRNRKSEIQGYHNQNFNSDSVEKILEYIYSHDMYRKYNPCDLYVPKQIRETLTPSVKGTKQNKKEKKCKQKYNRLLYRQIKQKRLMFLFEKIEMTGAY